MSIADGGGSGCVTEGASSSPPPISFTENAVRTCHTPGLQIPSDEGSDILPCSVRNAPLQPSIHFERKIHEESDFQRENSDLLHGALADSSAQTVDVKVFTPQNDNQLASLNGEVELFLEVPPAETVSTAPEGHLDLLHGHDAGTAHIEKTEEIIFCDGEKKRIREGHDDLGRNMKSKTSVAAQLDNRIDEERCCMETEEAKGTATVNVEVTVLNTGENNVMESVDNRNTSEIIIEENKDFGLADSTKSHGNEAAAAAGTVQLEKGTLEECNSVVKEGSADGQGMGEDRDMKNDNSARGGARKRRKIAMLLAYCGAGYQGMQKNPGAITIEGELEKALIKAGAMPDNFDGNPRRVDWMRAARTDKGVSAVGQIVSGLFYVDPPGFVDRVNLHLPKQIRLLGYRRVTPSFNAKKFCDRRRYEYVIPTFALDPSTHRDRESVLENEGKEGAFAKCLECCERGRKIPVRKVCDKQVTEVLEISTIDSSNAIDDKKDSVLTCEAVIEKHGLPPAENAGKQSADSAPSEKGQNALSATEQNVSPGLTSSTIEVKKEKYGLPPAENAGEQSADSAPSETQQNALSETEQSVNPGSTNSTTEVKKTVIFQFGEAERNKLDRILNYYVGTHNFHNFTSKIKADDPSAKRYIVSFEVGNVFTVNGTEFVTCTVVGQSFMLHQIRKMVGLAIAVFRGCAPESMINMALRRDVNVTIPTAPELGLFLDECMYPAYNRKWYETHEEISQCGYENEISDFKHTIIYQHIAQTEYGEGQMALFLHSLNDRNYTDFVMAKEAEKVAK